MMTEAQLSTVVESIEKVVGILKGARHWTPMEVEIESGRARELLESTIQDIEDELERALAVKANTKDGSSG